MQPAVDDDVLRGRREGGHERADHDEEQILVRRAEAHADEAGDHPICASNPGPPPPEEPPREHRRSTRSITGAQMNFSE